MVEPISQSSSRALVEGLKRVRRVLDLSAASHLEVKQAIEFIDALSVQAAEQAKPKGEDSGSETKA